jgi:hypothetical protein
MNTRSCREGLAAAPSPAPRGEQARRTPFQAQRHAERAVKSEVLPALTWSRALRFKDTIYKGLQGMVNAYLVSTASGSRFEDIPFDNQLMVWRHVHEQMLVDRYRARVLAYSFEGRGACISADRDGLWQGVLDALTAVDQQRINLRDVTYELDPQLPHVLRRIETHLRAVLDRVFVPTPDTPLDMNLTGPAWTQMAFHVERMIPEDYELTHDEQNVTSQINRIGFWASSADNLHQVRLILGWRLGTSIQASPPQSIHIRYIGPQRFGTFHRDDGNLLQEY